MIQKPIKRFITRDIPGGKYFEEEERGPNYYSYKKNQYQQFTYRPNINVDLDDYNDPNYIDFLDSKSNSDFDLDLDDEVNENELSPSSGLYSDIYDIDKSGNIIRENENTFIDDIYYNDADNVDIKDITDSDSDSDDKLIYIPSKIPNDPEYNKLDYKLLNKPSKPSSLESRYAVYDDDINIPKVGAGIGEGIYRRYFGSKVKNVKKHKKYKKHKKSKKHKKNIRSKRKN